METSAKNNENAHKAFLTFLTLIKEIIKIYREKNSEFISDIEEKNEKKSSTNENGKAKGGSSIKGVSGGYTIQIDVTEDN